MKLQLTGEELIQLARGELPTEEIKQNLAKSMLEVWNRPETQKLIEEEAKRLAQAKMERIIRDAMIEEKGKWGYQKGYSGWVMPILAKVLNENFSIPYVMEALKPDIDKLVEESLGRALAKLLKKDEG